MFDLFGAVPIDRSAVETSIHPFRHLQGKEQLKFTESHVDIDGQHWRMLHSGEQADFFQDATITVLMHGNCYTRSGTAQDKQGRRVSPRDLAERYRKSGSLMMRELKGSFALVVIDSTCKRLVVFTDPLNLRTVYYTNQGGTLLISTSLTAIAGYLSEKKLTLRPDRRAILDLYLFDFTLDEHTFLDGVRELGPGAELRLENGKLSVSTWFDPFQSFRLSAQTLNRRDGAALVRNVLSENIRLYNEGPENTAVALTGGFDSRSILALLDGQPSAYTFFSYGARHSWDLKIPQTIADRLHLKYVPIYLEEEYQSSFPTYSNLAVLLSDGAAEFSHANIPYVYANFLRDKRSILTGLFGSELIKTPSSRGLFLDTNSIALLTAKDPASAMHSIFRQMDESAVTLPFFDGETREQVIDMVANHPFINNDLPGNEKFFYYLLMVGVRKYFRKETKIQRFWKNNLHPFFDIEFVSTLLETPFPWVYNFSEKKSLVRNIRIHKLYGSIINENPVLSDIVSTHGYRPGRLTKPFGVPMLALEYLRNKKKISSTTTLGFQQGLALKQIEMNSDLLFRESGFGGSTMLSGMGLNPKTTIKIASLQSWLKSVGLSM